MTAEGQSFIEALKARVAQARAKRAKLSRRAKDAEAPFTRDMVLREIEVLDARIQALEEALGLALTNRRRKP